MDLGPRLGSFHKLFSIRNFLIFSWFILTILTILLMPFFDLIVFTGLLSLVIIVILKESFNLRGYLMLSLCAFSVVIGLVGNMIFNTYIEVLINVVLAFS